VEPSGLTVNFPSVTVAEPKYLLHPPDPDSAVPPLKTAVTETFGRAFCPLISTSRQEAPTREDAAAATFEEDGEVASVRATRGFEPPWHAPVEKAKSAVTTRTVFFKTKVS
jgi:hypothetical protein